MSTHTAVVTASVRGRLQTMQVPTISPAQGEVLVRVEWTASTPLDLHQNDGGLLTTPPQVLGSALAGTVVQLGAGVNNLKVGDQAGPQIFQQIHTPGTNEGVQVFGFTWRSQQEKAHQEFATVPEFLVGKVPVGFKPEEAVTLTNNFVTVFHAVTVDLGLPLPWPVPAPTPPHANDPILIWGGSSSVGEFALQILRHWGYQNLLTTASKPHHTQLKTFGAKYTFDYRDPNVTSQILEAADSNVPFVLDCIGSKFGSLAPIARIAKKGSRVAILLPVVVKDASETEAPEYSMVVQPEADWAEGVETRGVRTHYYLNNEYFKEHLQPTIMPTLLAEGIVKPNKVRIVEGKTLLERAQGAMDALRRKEVSGERLVWRIAE